MILHVIWWQKTKTKTHHSPAHPSSDPTLLLSYRQASCTKRNCQSGCLGGCFDLICVACSFCYPHFKLLADYATSPAQVPLDPRFPLVHFISIFSTCLLGSVVGHFQLPVASLPFPVLLAQHLSLCPQLQLLNYL